MGNRFFVNLLACGLVSASFASTPANAESTWACEVLLCASNPGGLMQFTVPTGAQVAQAEVTARPGPSLGRGSSER